MPYTLELISEISPSFPFSSPEIQRTVTEHPYALVQTAERIELRELSGDKSALAVDFVGGALGYRRLHGGGNGQAVAKAVGCRGSAKPLVIDATAGMGRDAFVLASLGCSVVMFERNPVVRALLEDGLRRAYADPEIGPMLRDRLILSEHSSIFELPPQKHCDAVYLDPMFPARRSSASVKKDMRIFHDVVGADPDSDALLDQALLIARNRVAVKRPKGAPFLNGRKTVNCVQTKAHRFDLYHP
ncbi:MAG: class I SAM-dependent methyltransferase [Succinivibrionaceae bacterium]|nr:class I SAM-dependent methyltransferase [Succinivibrionaceae bacterium]